jgi:hypothetical protein
VKLDGAWSVPVKDLVISLGPKLRDWVNEKAGVLSKIESEEEEGKDATS